MELIKTKQLTKKYDRVVAVDHVDMTIRKGDIYGLVGRNGAGKSTLLKMITGLSDPTEGELWMMGKNRPAEINRIRKNVGQMIEGPEFYAYLSARENLKYQCMMRGISTKEITEVLKLVKLEDTKKPFSKFSMGMKQRLGIASGLLGHPDILILDEPINGLDPMGIKEFRDLMIQLKEEQELTTIISSHILGELSMLATRFGFIENGKIIEEISRAELSEKCKDSLNIKVDSTQKAAVVIEEVLGTTHYKVINSRELQLYDRLQEGDLVAKVLIDRGISLYSMCPNQMSLEDYYVGLIGGRR